LEEGVRRMSSLPAERLKIWDRGILRPGMKADLVIFDPAVISDKATFEKPHQYSVGVRDVIVNGKLAMRDGKVTADRPGQILYGPAHK
jgi:N-acyl-D-aspartate/D-glutamate deacylase